MITSLPTISIHDQDHIDRTVEVTTRVGNDESTDPNMIVKWFYENVKYDVLFSSA